MTWASDPRLARRLARTALASAAATWLVFAGSLDFTEPDPLRTQVFALLGMALVATGSIAGLAAVVLGLRARPRDKTTLGVAAVALFLIAPFAALSVLLSGNLDY